MTRDEILKQASDELKPARGIAWAVGISAIVWILLGAGICALFIHWGWIR